MKLEITETSDRLYPFVVCEAGKLIGRFPTRAIAERIAKSLEGSDGQAPTEHP